MIGVTQGPSCKTFDHQCFLFEYFILFLRLAAASGREGHVSCVGPVDRSGAIFPFLTGLVSGDEPGAAAGIVSGDRAANMEDEVTESAKGSHVLRVFVSVRARSGQSHMCWRCTCASAFAFEWARLAMIKRAAGWCV